MLNIGDIKVNSVDYILIVDRDFSVLFNTRYDPRVSASSTGYEKSEYLNKSFFEVYPNIDRKSSSIVECISTGQVVIRKRQKYIDYKGQVFFTHNITVPIIHVGQILGAVELVKDITTIENVDNKNTDEADKDFDKLAAKIKNQVNVITFDDIVTQNNYMLKNIERAKFLSRIKNPTLIYGETGTGKEVFVQAIIQYSGIPKNKVVIQNCAAVPENLIESILFGTSKGAYTGAENKKGLFEEADGGIIFLDELNSMPYHVQSKLLRALQDGSFRPIGSNSEKKVDVKIIAAINIDPMEAIKRKELRSDLFYRFSSSMIHLPPLRERKDDIDHYVKHYIKEFNQIYNKNIDGCTLELEAFLKHYSWNGNVRELKHVIESMIGTADDNILDIQHLPAYLYDQIYSNNKEEENIKIQLAEKPSINKDSLNLIKALKKTEKEIIIKAMKLCGGNKTKCSSLLGIPRQTLNYKLKKLNIELELKGSDEKLPLK